jgi:GMP synthase (glutamine-hydrolysing)
MTAPRVLILDLSIDRDLYRPTAHWRALLGPVESVSVHLPTGEAAPALASVSHVIITGSEASIIEPRAWFEPAEAVIHEAVRRGLPLLGSCFGHQLIVRALVGPDHVRRAAVPELGWFPVRPAPGDPLLGRLGDPVWMFACHLDEVFDLPPPWQVLGATDACAVHVARLGAAPVLGVQAHPEIPPDLGRELLLGFAAARPDLRPAVERGLAEAPRDSGFGRALVDAFLR